MSEQIIASENNVNELEKSADEINIDAADPFSPENLQARPEFYDALPMERVITNIPVRKSKKHEWFTVKPDFGVKPDGSLYEYFLFEHDTGETSKTPYLVTGGAVAELVTYIQTVRLFLCVSRHGAHFIYPVKIPKEGRGNSNASRTALAGLEIGKTKIDGKATWILMSWNSYAGQYDCAKSRVDIEHPGWPKMSDRSILKLAFEDKFIQTADHTVVRQVLGLA